MIKRIKLLFVFIIMFLICNNVWALDDTIYVTVDELVVGAKPPTKVSVKIGNNISYYDVKWLEYGFYKNKSGFFDMNSNSQFLAGHKYSFSSRELNELLSDCSEVECFINDNKIIDLESFYMYPKMNDGIVEDVIVKEDKYDNKSSGDVVVKSIELLSKSNNSEIIKNPTYHNLNLDLGFKFIDVGDEVLYKVILGNNSSKDYQITKQDSFSDSTYIKYDYSFDDKTNIIKSNSEKVMFVKATYFREVDEDFLDDGVYTETNNLKIVMNNNEVVNPNTGKSVIFCALLIGITLTLIFVFNPKISKRYFIFILMAIFSYPIITSAIDEISIVVDTDVLIARQNKFCVAYYDVDDYNDFKDDNNRDIPHSVYYYNYNDGDIVMDVFSKLNFVYDQYDNDFLSYDGTLIGFHNYDLVKDYTNGCYDLVSYFERK